MATLMDVREAFDEMGVDIGKGMEAQCECAGRSREPAVVRSPPASGDTPSARPHPRPLRSVTRVRRPQIRVHTHLHEGDARPRPFGRERGMARGKAIYERRNGQVLRSALTLDADVSGPPCIGDVLPADRRLPASALATDGEPGCRLEYREVRASSLCEPSPHTASKGAQALQHASCSSQGPSALEGGEQESFVFDRDLLRWLSCWGGADAGVSLAVQFNTSAGDLASAFLSFMYSRCVLYPPPHPASSLVPCPYNPIQPNSHRTVNRLRRYAFHPVPLRPTNGRSGGRRVGSKTPTRAEPTHLTHGGDV